MWLLAGPIKCNWPSVTLWSVFQYPVTYEDFAIDNQTTFISVEVGLAIDTSMDALSNRNFPIDPVMALPVNDYTEDTTSPVVEQPLLLDYDEGLFWLQFNEPVNISSINYTLFSILQVLVVQIQQTA